MLLRTSCSGNNNNHRLFALRWNVFFIFACGMIAATCKSTDNKNANFGYSETRNLVNGVHGLVNNLVLNRHPDPVGLLDSTYSSDKPDPLDLYRKYLGIQFYFSEHQKDYESALIYADSTLQLLEGKYDMPKYKALYLYAIIQKGDALRDQHLYGTSIQYLLQGWQMVSPEESPCLSAEFLDRMAIINYKQENYPKTIEFYNRAWQLNKKCPDQTDFSRFQIDFQYLQNIAANYEQLQMPDSALHYNNLSLKVLEKDSSRFTHNSNQYHFIEVANGVALGNKASVLLKLRREEEAEKLWKESIRINTKPSFANEHAQLMRLWLTNYYVDVGRLKEAEELLVVVRNWLDEFHSETGELRWRRIKWKWFDKSGYTEQAYLAYQQYIDLQQAAKEDRTELGATDLDTQIKLSEQQDEIMRLRTEGEIRSTYLTSAIIISFMAIVILFLIWLNWRESKKSVSELTKLNKTVFKQNLQLEEKNHMLSTIMNVVTHDLRSPLVGVTELSAIMLDDRKLTNKQRWQIELIHDTVGRSMNLAKEILTLNHPQVHLDKLQKEPVHLHTFLQQCVDILQLLAKEKNQFIQIESDKNIVISFDKNEMTRVINNIIFNAIKFSPKDSVIFVKLEQKLQKVMLSIRDEGIGIPDDLKETVFDIFTTAKRPGTDNEQSFGIGLSVSRQIVKAHGGRIWFESKNGAGTTFYIELPLSQEKPVKIT